MSDTETPAPIEPRPWHNAESPFEALYQWFVGEIARIEGKSPKPVSSAPLPIEDGLSTILSATPKDDAPAE